MTAFTKLNILNYKLYSLSAAQQHIRFFRRHMAPTLFELRHRQKRNPVQPKHRNTFLEWNYNAELYSFGKRLGEDFEDSLLRQALTERSYAIKEEEEQKKLGIEDPEINYLKDNKDLSSKGEEIIKRFILQYLRYTLPRLPEEGIVSIMEYLISEEVLSHVSFHIGTSEIILCADYPVEKSTMATVLKALVGALAESSSINRTTIFIRDFILTQLAGRNVNDLWPIENSIEVVTKICKNEGLPEPEPRLIGEAGCSTILACYRVGLYVNKQIIGLGFGESVDIAHEMAAQDTLRRLFKTSEFDLNIPFDIVLEPQLDNQIANISVENWSEENLKKHKIYLDSQTQKNT